MGKKRVNKVTSHHTHLSFSIIQLAQHFSSTHLLSGAALAYYLCGIDISCKGSRGGEAPP